MRRIIQRDLSSDGRETVRQVELKLPTMREQFDRWTKESRRREQRSAPAHAMMAGPTSVWCYFPDDDEEVDEISEKLHDLADSHGGEEEGGGSDGTTRDLSFHFETREEAEGFAEEAKRIADEVELMANDY